MVPLAKYGSLLYIFNSASQTIYIMIDDSDYIKKYYVLILMETTVYVCIQFIYMYVNRFYIYFGFPWTGKLNVGTFT